MIGESSKQGAKGTQCYKCHDYDHVATQCPSKNLLVEGAGLDDDEFGEKIYEAVRSVGDTD